MKLDVLRILKTIAREYPQVHNHLVSAGLTVSSTVVARLLLAARIPYTVQIRPPTPGRP